MLGSVDPVLGNRPKDHNSVLGVGVGLQPRDAPAQVHSQQLLVGSLLVGLVADVGDVH